MSKILSLCFLAAIYSLVVLSWFKPSSVLADTGDRNAVRICAGNTFQTRVVSLPTGKATQIVPSLANRCDETCYNNSANIVWLSSNVAVTTQAVTMGFPIASSATFKLNSISTSVYATPDTANSSAGEIRCADGLTF